MKSLSLVEGYGDADFVQTKEEVRDADSSLVLSVPLAEDAMQVGPRCVLPSESTSDVHDVLLVDNLVKRVRLVIFGHGRCLGKSLLNGLCN